MTITFIEDSDHTASVSHENEQRARSGAAVHLSCNVSQPNVRIVWTKDGRALPRSVRQKQDGSLFIRRAQKSDSGKYVCSVQDSYRRVITSNYINLHIQGQFHRQLISQLNSSGGAATAMSLLLSVV